MSITENVGTFEHEVHDRAGILPQESGSLLSAFQRTRRDLAQRGPREEVKLVPLWEGALRIVYRYPDGGADAVIRAVERATEAGNRAKDDGKRDNVFNANADLLIQCCHDIEFRDPDTGEWRPLDEDGPSRITHKLAGKLEIEIPERTKSPSRLILRHLFSPQAATTGKFEGDVSLLDQAGDVLIWLRAADERVDEELRGE